MINFCPKQIAHRAIFVYLIVLACISMVYLRYSMSWGYIALGITWVAGFFMLAGSLSRHCRKINDRAYVQNIILVALGLRLLWVIASYFYYLHATGTPFEFGSADSFGYHDAAIWLAGSPWSTAWNYYFGPDSIGVSDVGYPLYLTALYKLIGPNIIVTRIIKACLSTFTCFLLYKLASRTFGEQTGRLAGIMAALMPNLIIYCGYHLKETEMLFLEVAFLERFDYLIRSKRINFFNVLLSTVLAVSLFFFRTVLGAAAIFAIASTLILASAPSMKKTGRRVMLISWGLLFIVALGGGTIATEAEGYWEEREENVVDKRYGQTLRGNQWAQYATGTVMAPMVFVLPYATMVNVDGQYGQQEKSGGNYIRNFMGLFAILAIIEAFRRKQWRDYITIGSFVIAYLGVISISGFSNSERFLLPGLPGLILLWSYGIATLREKTYRFITPWCFIVFVMEFAWAFFKLGSRGLFQ